MGWLKLLTDSIASSDQVRHAAIDQVRAATREAKLLNIDAERKAFEHWYDANEKSDSMFFQRDDQGDYTVYDVYISWRAWIARASLTRETPPTRP